MRFQPQSGAPLTAAHKFFTAITALLIALVSACDDDSPSGGGITLNNSWPNEDGRGWSYEVTWSQWSTLAPLPPEVLFANPDDVPPAPSLTKAAALLDVEFTGPPVSSGTGLYTLQFEGTHTTESGARGQHLVETLDGVPTVAKAAGMPTVPIAFLRRLAVARPDLRARIQELIGHEEVDENEIPWRFLHGGAWEKTSDWIGTYGDLNTMPAWIYLDADLDTGHEFSLQLVPDLADDVYLHVRVVGRVTVENDAGTYRNALEVVYEVDYGLFEATDVDGNVLGYMRFFEIARIAYVANVGPVDSEEQGLYAVGSDGPWGPTSTLKMPLLSTVTPEP